VRLKQVAPATQRSLYQVKHSLWSDYLRQQLRAPSVQMVLAQVLFNILIERLQAQARYGNGG
jgi:hypothetical protein